MRKMAWIVLPTLLTLTSGCATSLTLLGPGANRGIVDVPPLVFRTTLDGGKVELVDCLNLDLPFLYD